MAVAPAVEVVVELLAIGAAAELPVIGATESGSVPVRLLRERYSDRQPLPNGPAL